MGRRLTPSERAQRERERDDRAAARRAKTASRRAREKEIRDKEKARQKAAKEAKSASEIQSNRDIQKDYDDYILSITSFHKGYNLKNFEGDYTKRLDKRSYEKNPLPSLKELNIKKFRWDDYKISDYNKPSLDIPKFKTEDEVTSLAFNPKIAKAITQWIPIGLSFIVSVNMELGFGETITMTLIILGIINGPFWIYKKSLFSRHSAEQERLKKEHDEKYAKEKKEHDKKHAKLKKEHDASEIEKEKEDIKKKAAAKATYEEEKEKTEKEYKENKENHQQKHEKKEKENKEKFDANDVKRIDVLNKAKDGDVESIEMIVESVLPLEHTLIAPRNMPEDTSVDGTEVGFDVVDAKTINIKFELPDLEGVIPANEYKITPKGTTLNLNDMSDRTSNKLKNQFVCSMAFHTTFKVLQAYPSFDSIFFEAFYTGIDSSTGKDKAITVLKVNFDKEALLNKVEVDRVPDIEDALSNFKYKFSKFGRTPKEIKSDINENELTWATPNDQDEDIPYGVNPDETINQLP